MDIFDYFESLRRSVQQNQAIGFVEHPVIIASEGRLSSFVPKLASRT